MKPNPDKNGGCVNDVISCRGSAENNFKRAKVRDFALPVAFLILATIAITATGADLKLSALFYIGGKWPVGELLPWSLLYKVDRFPALFMAACGLFAAFLGLLYQNRRHWVRPGLFLVILLALGPVLIVNTVFKEHWGRPRPRDILQFGGTKEFLHPWQKGIAHGGRAFPSGHSSGAFYLTAPFFIYRRRNQRIARLWLIGGISFGLMMSIARIAQGAHFLSDTLWAWGIIHLTAVTLYYLLRLHRDEAPSAAE
ncbi:MAG: phosphatase PAP2 family protein [Desulfuromonadaceae bacterium]